jgi:hypothetical protein
VGSRALWLRLSPASSVGLVSILRLWFVSSCTAHKEAALAPVPEIFLANKAANLALIYASKGKSDEAIALIERLLSTPGPVAWPDFAENITLADLRLRREWDPLRSDPRFQKILAGPEPKTVY